MIALRLEVHVMDQDLAQFDRPLPRQGLHQFALAVARHPGDADDFARLDLEIEPGDGVAPLVVLSEETCDLQRRPALRRGGARRGRTHHRIPDHHRRHFARRNGADLPAAHASAAPEHREIVAERLDLAEFVTDHRDRDFAAVRHIAQEPENLVGLARRQYRRRLVQDEKALIKIEQFEDFELLLFSRRQAGHRPVERRPERHAVEKAFEALSLLAPVDERRRVGAAHDEIFRRRQRRHEGEMLIDHANAEGLRVPGIAHGRLAPVEQQAGRGRECRSP